MLNQFYRRSLQNAKEYPKPVSLGKIPYPIRGTYIQNGPGEFDRWGIQTHPFDGDGYIRKLEFRDGEVFFQGRYINTWQRKLEEITHSRLFTGAFGSHPKHLMVKNPVNTNVVFLDENRIAASSEMGRTYVLDLKTLETTGMYEQNISAHTHEHISVQRFYENQKTHLVFDSSVHVHLPNFVYFHDFIVTENYFVFFDHHLTLDLWKGWKEGWVNGIQFHEQPSDIYVVHRKTSEIFSIKVPEVIGFSYHFICGKQYDDRLEVYYILYPGFFSTPKEEFPGKIYRTVIYLNERTQETQCVNSIWMEFPVYDKKTNECFGIFPSKSGLGMLDLNTQKAVHYRTNGKIFNEPFFDDHYLMSIVYDAHLNKSELYIFDRSHIFEKPYVLPFPLMLPMGLHGTWRNATESMSLQKD
jgi:all-trans-8'-apo-beta-carotenal 15,15'-oxygenase